MKKYIFIFLLFFTIKGFAQGSTTTVFDTTGWSPAAGYSQYYKLYYFDLLSNPGGRYNINTRNIDLLLDSLIVYTDTSELYILNDTLRLSPTFISTLYDSTQTAVNWALVKDSTILYIGDTATVLRAEWRSDINDSLTTFKTIVSDTADVLRTEWKSDISDSIAAIPIFKSYMWKARDASTGENYTAGFYDVSTVDANLTQASTTVTFGGANHPYAAHAFIVSGGSGATDGSDLVLTVSGTSITDGGVRTAADSEVIEPTADVSALNSYYETTKKWLGQVTFTLTSTGGTTFNYDFNYGYNKYEDFGNRDFTLTDVEFTGLANANDGGFDIEVIKHQSTGWTYAATGFDPSPNVLYQMTTIHGTESDIDAGEAFAFKRAGLSVSVTGSGSEGLLIRVTTGVANSVTYMSCHLGVTF